MPPNKKLSPQSKSFIILFVLAIVGAYLCFMLWANTGFTPSQMGMQDYGNQGALNTQVEQTSEVLPTPTPVPAVDTTGWQTYTNAKYNFSFLYPTGWKVLNAVSQGDYEVIQVDPGLQYYNIKIYISPQGYYILGGLPTKNETIDGQPALNVSNALYGITANNLYYTFDVGWSMSLVPKFDALVHSVQFSS